MSSTQRIYNCTDLELLNAARDFATSLQVDLSDFEAVDTSLDAIYFSLFETEIAVAESLDPSNSVEAQMRIATEAVKAQMEAAYAALRPVNYFVGELWPGNKARKKEFGIDGISTLLTSQDKMLASLSLCATKLAEYQVELLAKGMTQVQIDAVGNARSALNTANDAQDEFRRTIPRLTDDRVTQYNKVYGMMQRINTLAKVVYAGDEASLNRYKLPRRNGTEGRHTLQPGNVYSHKMIAPQEGDSWTVHNYTTDAPLVVCMQPEEGESCTTGLSVGPQTELTFELQDLGAIQEYLTITNQSVDKVVEFSYRKD